MTNKLLLLIAALIFVVPAFAEIQPDGLSPPAIVAADILPDRAIIEAEITIQKFSNDTQDVMTGQPAGGLPIAGDMSPALPGSDAFRSVSQPGEAGTIACYLWDRDTCGFWSVQEVPTSHGRG